MSSSQQKINPTQFSYSDCGSRMPSCVPKDMAFIQSSSLAPSGGIGIGKYSPVALQRARQRAKPAGTTPRAKKAVRLNTPHPKKAATIEFHNVSTGANVIVDLTTEADEESTN